MDEKKLEWSQYRGDARRIALTDTELATPIVLPDGLYQLGATVACRWKQDNSWCRFAGTPATPTVVTHGTAGVTTYGYKAVARMPDVDFSFAGSGKSAASAEGTVGTGNATLSATNYNTATVTAVTGAIGYDWYRTTGGATQGLIGTTTAPTINDIGLAASGTAPSIATSIGNPHPGGGLFFGDIEVHSDATRYFNLKTQDSGATGFAEFLPINED